MKWFKTNTPEKVEKTKEQIVEEYLHKKYGRVIFCNSVHLNRYDLYNFLSSNIKDNKEIIYYECVEDGDYKDGYYINNNLLKYQILEVNRVVKGSLTNIGDKLNYGVEIILKEYIEITLKEINDNL